MDEKVLNLSDEPLVLDKHLTMSLGPHVKSNESTRRIMLDVIIALTPAMIGAIYYFGLNAAMLIVISVASAVLFEAATQKFFKKDILIGDFSAVVTGLLLAFNLPANAPWWIPVFGAAFAIIIVKEFFGGIGSNFMNPALAARVALVSSWPVIMGTYIGPDGVTGATPMALIKSGSAEIPSLFNMFIGNIGGSLGETSALLLLIGAAYLFIRKVIDWKIPFIYIGTTIVMLLILGVNPDMLMYHVFGGGLILGAFFMATDYSSSPVTPNGKILFGIGAGILTALIRVKGGMPEGVSYAILIMNVASPVIEKFTKPKVFGRVK